MAKTYLISTDIDLDTVEEGDTIVFEMPPFCSGDYTAKVKSDERGIYIDKKDDFFSGCRDYDIIKNKL